VASKWRQKLTRFKSSSSVASVIPFKVSANPARERNNKLCRRASSAINKG
jgi:hypothetical protein